MSAMDWPSPDYRQLYRMYETMPDKPADPDPRQRADDMFDALQKWMWKDKCEAIRSLIRTEIAAAKAEGMGNIETRIAALEKDTHPPIDLTSAIDEILEEKMWPRVPPPKASPAPPPAAPDEALRREFEFFMQRRWEASGGLGKISIAMPTGTDQEEAFSAGYRAAASRRDGLIGRMIYMMRSAAYVMDGGDHHPIALAIRALIREAEGGKP